jgi:hypothetical protein
VSAKAPLAPKFYGGIAGVGTGAALSAAIVAVIQAYWIHKTLDPAAVQLIYLVIPLLGTAYGIWKAPHQVRPGDVPAEAVREVAGAAVAEVLAQRPVSAAGRPVMVGGGVGLDILGPERERTGTPPVVINQPE